MKRADDSTNASRRRERGSADGGNGLSARTVGLLCCLSAPAAGAVSMECDETGTTVTAPERTDAEHACEAARSAISFLASNGLHTAAPMQLHLVAKLPEDRVREGMFACYSHLDGAVHVLTLSACRGKPGPFGLRMDRALHQGVVAHEVAHAVAALNFEVEHPSSLAQEYIAYVAQLATLSDERREQILARYPDSPLQPEAAVNRLLLAMEPSRFAARAYRHFVGLGRGSALLQRVLAGEALTTDATDANSMYR